MTADAAALGRWRSPTPIRWPLWLALYALALALNRHYAPQLLDLMHVTKPTLSQLWLVRLLPALVFVTIALLLRWCWYQVWLIYQRSNEWVHEHTLKANAQYCAETVAVEQVLFCCGQLGSFKDFKRYWQLPPLERASSVFESIDKQIPFSSEHELGQDRLTALLLHLVRALQRQNLLASDYQQWLWLWLGDADSWRLFRLQVIECGGHCPAQPDRYIQDSDINWVIDRAQEDTYQAILLLGYEYQPNLELYLALVLGAKGRLARLGRAFATKQWSTQQANFVATLDSGMARLQLCSDRLNTAEVMQWVAPKQLLVTAASLAKPDFFQVLEHTQGWLWLVCALSLLEEYPLVIDLEGQQLLLLTPG